MPKLSEELFVGDQRVSAFPEKEVDFWGGRGTSREVRGSYGEIWETSGGNL